MVQEAISELSKHNSNILLADTTTKYVIEKLRALNSTISLKFCDALIKRYKSRRLSDEVSLLHLHTKMEYLKETEGFEKCPKKDIKLTASNLFKRLYPEKEIATETEPEDQLEPVSEGIRLSQEPSKATTKVDIDEDLKMLEAVLQLTPCLENLRDALLSIPPTSTICEQAFSIAESFKTKKRNRIGHRLSKNEHFGLAQRFFCK